MANESLSQKINNLSPREIEDIRYQALAEKTLRDRYGASFKQFIKEINPDYNFYRFNEKIIDALDKVERGELKRLMIFCPPRMGKSELASRLFPAYFLFKNPTKHFGLCSYSSDLAYSLSRNARDNYEKTGRHLSEDASSVKEWHTDTGGVFWSSGVGGSQTGKGFSCGLIDDYCKNWEEALSTTVQESQWDWYISTFFTRKAPLAALIVIATRWSENDLAGRILRSEAYAEQNWHIINFQAVREKNNVVKIPKSCVMEPDWRKEGEVIEPKMFSAKEVKDIRNLTETGTRVWQSLYQQNPVAEEGVIWKKKWFDGNEYDDTSKVNIVNVGYDWDTAYTEDEKNAAHAFVKAGVGDDGNIYVMDIDFKWVEFPEFIEWAERLPKFPHYVERKASGKSAVPMLSKVGLRAIEVPVFGGDKVSRSIIASPMVEKGKVKIHRSIMTRLLYDDRQGILKFPNGTHKDLNDAFVQMLNRLKPFTKSAEVKKPEYNSMDEYMQAEFSKIQDTFMKPKSIGWHQA
jgi:hypothetical protein